MLHDVVPIGALPHEGGPVEHREHRVLVAQLGARRHYAVPLALCLRGMLERLYTDVYASGGFLARAARLGGRLFGAKWLKRWAGRSAEGLPSHRVTTLAAFGFQYRWRVHFAQTAAQKTRAWLWGGHRFCELIAGHDFGGANVIYTFNSAGLELLRRAREAGLLGIVDQTIAPKLVEQRLLLEEEGRYPGWSSTSMEDPLAADYAQREKEEWSAAHAVICGSEFVREGIREEGGASERVHVVPSGTPQRFQLGRRPVRRAGPLRALCVGTVGLRKGIGDLASAAALLDTNRVHVRAIGRIELTAAGHRAVRQSVELTGPIPRSQMLAEYRHADAFVLPSVCEGSAAACYEALAAGLPVITTPNAGSVARDGIDGFIVPIRSPAAIAEKLDRLASDRSLLEEMSENARARARQFTIQTYAQRLTEALDQAHLNHGLPQALTAVRSR